MLTVTDGMWSAYRRNFLPELKTDAAQHLFCALVAIFPSYRTLRRVSSSASQYPEKQLMHAPTGPTPHREPKKNIGNNAISRSWSPQPLCRGRRARP